MTLNATIDNTACPRASQAYAARLAQIHIKCEQLSSAIEAHAVRQATAPDHWGYVGDLNALDVALTQALEPVGLF